jgi:hypothetical protein
MQAKDENVKNMKHKNTTPIKIAIRQPMKLKMLAPPCNKCKKTKQNKIKKEKKECVEKCLEADNKHY